MKILFIHNSYSETTPSGEEHASRELASLLEEHGHVVRWFKRNSDVVRASTKLTIASFFSGIYNPFIKKELANVIEDFKPDVAQVQNIYPLISSSIFEVLKKYHIPVVMRCPNYRLFCPSGLSLDKKGNVCEKCWGKGHELWCIKGNCENSLPKSIGYASRNAFNRITGKIRKGVDVFIVQSEFQKKKFMGQGIPGHKIGIVPGISPNISVQENIYMGDWVSFVGRVSAEKGIYEFIEVARHNPEIPFKVAGALDVNFEMPNNIPDNLEFVGFLKGADLDNFYLKSRIIVVPSKWYEGFPNVILRGFLLNRPVITTNIGAMQSIVDTGINGTLVESGSVEDLSKAVVELYPKIELCRQYGEAGRKKALIAYSREQIYNYLVEIYRSAIERNFK